MLKQRVITALAMLFVLLVAVFQLSREGWIAFASVIVAVAAWEWAGLVLPGTVWKLANSAIATALFLTVVAFSGVGSGTPEDRVPGLLLVLGGAAVFWTVLAPIWLSAKWPLRGALTGLPVGLFVVVPAGVALVVLRDGGPWLLLATMAVVWVADIAAYFVGRSIGKRKLAPGISPGKSWEGALGAGVFVVIYGFVAARWLPELDVITGRGFAVSALFCAILVVLTAVSIVGDLFESLAKRQAGVKDSGTILPGHGGLLDRIDSLTSTLPLVALALLLARPHS